MKRLCIIPARGGSKRLPNKNVTFLNNKPLICHTIDAAVESGLFDKIIFTSDSELILEVASEHQTSEIVTFSKRPTELATDTSKVIDTVNYYQGYNDGFDQIWLLLPTCPLRTSEDLVEASEMLTEDIDGIVSITEMEFPPTLGLNKSDDGMITAYDESDPWVNGNSRSQDHPTVYRPNGAIYASWTEKFVENQNFYKGNVKGYFMPRSKSIDIDTKFDFELAKQMFDYGDLY